MTDTIVALATAPGVSGLAIVRLSGPEAIATADSCFVGKTRLDAAKSHTIHYGKIIFDDKLIDTVTVSVFREPHSFTGENSIEITCHGGTIVANEIINAIIKHGARLADAGEFTKRAFLNNRLDLAQVEAVADIIHSVTEQGCQTAARQLNGEFTERLKKFRQKLADIAAKLELELDFADEDITLIDKKFIEQEIIETKDFCLSLADSFKSAEILRSGFFVAIVGYPNSGKSTLFNTMLNRKRAIVSDIPGTTRDYLEELLYIDGIAVKLIDTAGIRDSDNIIEIEGIKMAESIIAESNLILVLNDISISAENSRNLYNELHGRFPENDVLYVQNKIDKDEKHTAMSNENDIFISAKQKAGIDTLKKKIYEFAVRSTQKVNDVMMNQRQTFLLKSSAAELDSALLALKNKSENEIISIHIRKAAKSFGEITGESWNEEVLNNIFTKFCIGK